MNTPDQTPSTLIYNGDVLLWSDLRGWHWDQTPIAIKGGRIFDIGWHLSTQDYERTVDLKGLKVLPGLIDSQVHFREPGFTHKEDLETGTRAAALGGITTIFEMPNTNPATTDYAALENKFERAKNRAHVHYAFYSGGSRSNAADIPAMENHPSSPGLKIFMGSSFGPMLVENDLDLESLLKASHRRVTVHCEDEIILNANKAQLPPQPSVTLHSQWRSPQSCLNATQRLVHMARRLNKKVHVLHVTTAQEVQFLVQNADVATFEILPQHLTLHAPDCYQQLGSLAQQNPPIREKEHQEALWQAVQRGWVSTLGSDHAPHTLEEKAKPYPQSPSGMPGVQTLLPIMLQHVHQQRLSLERLVEMMTLGVIQVFGLKNKGRIAPGYDADFTIVDLKKEVTLSHSQMASKCGWTPFDGYKVTGFPVMTWCQGQQVMEQGQIIKAHQGRPAYFSNPPL